MCFHSLNGRIEQTFDPQVVRLCHGRQAQTTDSRPLPVPTRVPAAHAALAAALSGPSVGPTPSVSSCPRLLFLRTCLATALKT